MRTLVCQVMQYITYGNTSAVLLESLSADVDLGLQERGVRQCWSWVWPPPASLSPEDLQEQPPECRNSHAVNYSGFQLQ